LLLADLRRSSTGSEPGLENGRTGLVVRSQKPPAQNLSWVAADFSTYSANNRTWNPSCAGWRKNHGRLGRIPDTHDRVLRIVSNLAWLVFKVKSKPKNQKDNLKYGFTE
jgi:hypothetical protein